mmetsp:Transcript_4175/g.8478  ORF Transcript_4175/g.8478 Transcript_4175/m.8478 type:complete len:218 (+) Transcript_4175:362-1015(+)
MQSFPHDFRTTIAFHLSPNPHKQKPWQCLVSRQVLYMIISSRKQNQLQHFQQHYTLLLLRIIIIIIIIGDRTKHYPFDGRLSIASRTARHSRVQAQLPEKGRSSDDGTHCRHRHQQIVTPLGHGPSQSNLSQGIRQEGIISHHQDALHATSTTVIGIGQGPSRIIQNLLFALHVAPNDTKFCMDHLYRSRSRCLSTARNESLARTLSPFLPTAGVNG